MSRFDWPVLMQAGFLRLGLRPAEFWALTPAELALMLGHRGAAALDRRGLEALLAAYPDGRETGKDESDDGCRDGRGVG